MNNRIWKTMAALSLFCGTLTVVAHAQTAPAVTKLDKFVVTGSLIPIAAGSPAIPVTVIGSAEIEKTGVSTDLLDVLRKSQPAFYGGNNLGSDVANINPNAEVETGIA